MYFTDRLYEKTMLMEQQKVKSMNIRKEFENKYLDNNDFKAPTFPTKKALPTTGGLAQAGV
jgi:hypothetical protein